MREHGAPIFGTRERAHGWDYGRGDGGAAGVGGLNGGVGFEEFGRVACCDCVVGHGDGFVHPDEAGGRQHGKNVFVT